MFFLLEKHIGKYSSKVVFTLAALLYSIVPAIFISMIFAVIAPNAERAEFPSNEFMLFYAVVIFSPLFETFLVWFFVFITNKFTQDKNMLVIIPAIIMAALHSSVAPIWGIIVFWSFIVYVFSFVFWRQKSLLLGFTVCTIIHMLQNTIAITSLLI